MSNKVCPNRKCGNTIAADADKFCYLCGTEMVPILPCECGHHVCRHDKFCPACGKKVQLAAKPTPIS